MRPGSPSRTGSSKWRAIGLLVVLAFIGLTGGAFLLTAAQGPGFEQTDARAPGKRLADLELTKPELYLSTSNVPLREVRQELPNRKAWDDSLGRLPVGADVHIDPRSGAASSIVTHVPLIPGDGHGNRITLQEIESSLGRTIPELDAVAVAELTLRVVRRHANALGIKPSQLGTPAAFKVNDDLWHFTVPQEIHGVPVRDARVAATISHGNLVLLGTESWGDVRVSPQPRIDSGEAIRLGFEHVGGRTPEDQIWQGPRLEIWPTDPQGWRFDAKDRSRLGKGYEHRLVWVLDFQRVPEEENWQVALDAATGEVLSFRDTNAYAKKKVKGGVYPASGNYTSDCPGPVCGVLQSGYPMPWADTGLASPENFTNSAGVINYTSGTVTTTLTGKYADITDTCGPISLGSGTGDIDLGGVNGTADCNAPEGPSAGNTGSARTVFYELNKIAEIGRAWLPSNTWLQGRRDVDTNVETKFSCNAVFTAQGKLRFWRTKTNGEAEGCSRCNSPGQTASVIAHEFGHGLDKNDATPSIGIFGEGYADIVAAYRHQQSCLGYGMRTEPQCEDGEFEFCYNPSNPPSCPQRCGLAADGLYNAYENVGFSGMNPDPGPHCTTDCSGARDADYAKHVHGTPDTPQNFVCTQCPGTGGPCGKDQYCAAAPMRQAAWDLAARDLPVQHGYDINTSFILASRLLYQGSGNTSAWHSCNCGAGTSDGCGSNSGYKQWLAADDDNGNLLDGTPHMQAIYNAFNRHNIACSTPTVLNGGCMSGPTSAPNLTVTAACGAVNLSWNTVAGAANYQVFRTEGHNGCNLGKALIATGPQTSYVDTTVADGRGYSYMVVPMTNTAACIGPGSTCSAATPTPITGNPVVTVNWPNGSNVLFMNTSVSLSWTATDTCGGVSSVDIQLSRNGTGGPFENLALGIPNTGSYNWLVTGPVTSNAFLKVTARDPGMNTGSDLSNAAFSISSGCGPCIVSWCRNENERCTWNSTCGPGACCNYSCDFDPSCTGADVCPESACSC